MQSKLNKENTKSKVKPLVNVQFLYFEFDIIFIIVLQLHVLMYLKTV